MKKATIVLFALFFAMAINGNAQNAPKDFFAGKWEITVIGTPNGDSKLIANLVRKEGKLTGELKDASDATKPAIDITNIVESADKIDIEFSTSGYDVSLSLEKIDDDNLKGQLMGMFDAKAIRIKK
jgi:hypothetical protein